MPSLLALSSRFLTPDPTGADDRIRRLLDFDLAAIAIDHPQTAEELRAWSTARRSSGAAIVRLASGILRAPESLLPQPRRPHRSPSLSSLDPDERRAAVEMTRQHLGWAEELECPTLVVSCGTIPIEHDSARWHDAFEAGRWRHGGRWVDAASEHEARLFEKRRAEVAPRALDTLQSSLDPVLSAADGRGVSIALENPRTPRGLGRVEELERCFDEFRGAPLTAWYDIGNADRLEQLGCIETRVTKARLESHLAGVTATDAIGLRDGLLPGQGTLLLPLAVAPLIDRDRDDNPPLVLRCERGTDDAAIRAALDRMRADGFGGPPPIEAEPFPIIGG
ncbi:MAG: TIM barrel protein [Planctomycetes bacterium]|nr:TIM barrel protein [Planctomycetota bacterium]